MRVGFLLDPLEELKEHKDSSVLMMRAASAAGHEVHAIPHGSLSLEAGELLLESLALEIVPEGTEWCRVARRERVAWRAGDPIVVRKDPPFDMAYLRSMQILDFARRSGVPVFNDPRAIMCCDEKLLALRHPGLTPATLVTSDADLVREFHRERGGCVLKPIGMMGGRGVRLSPAEDPGLDDAIVELTAGGSLHGIAQERVDEAAAGDKRVLVIGGEPQPFMVRRIPSEDDFRGNIDAGAKPVAEPLGERERRIAEAVAADLADEGILLAGLDILGDRLTEVNITSPTCMREIKDQTGHDCGEAFMRCVERRC